LTLPELPELSELATGIVFDDVGEGIIAGEFWIVLVVGVGTSSYSIQISHYF